MKITPLFRSGSIILLLLFFLVIAIIYSPVLYFDYLYHDDSYFWLKLKEYGLKHYLYYSCMISQCRYSLAFLLNLENIFVEKVSDLKFLRFLGLVITSCNAYLLFQQMRRSNFSDIQAFLVVPAIFFLPGYAVNVFNSATCCIISLSIFFACLSFQKIQTCTAMALPVIYLFIAITIYQPFAMFYWVLTGMQLLFAGDRNSARFKKEISRSMAVGLLGLLTYAVSVYVMHYFFASKVKANLYNAYIISWDLPGKIQWFCHEPMQNALNLWNIFPRHSTSMLVSGFIIITGLMVIAKNLIDTPPPQRKGTALNDTWPISLLIFIFFLTFLPNLAAKNNVAFYRCLFPLTSLICLMLVWCIFKWMEMFPDILAKWGKIALLSFIVVFAGVKTYQNVLCYRVMPSYVEYKAYKSMVKELRTRKVEAVDILVPFFNFPTERYDEFGGLTSQYYQDLFQILYCAYKENGIDDRQAMPLLYVTFPNGQIVEIHQVLFKKQPNGKWIYKDYNRSGRYYKAPHGGVSMDVGIVPAVTPLNLTAKGRNWYILNLSDKYNVSDYKDLFK